VSAPDIIPFIRYILTYGDEEWTSLDYSRGARSKRGITTEGTEYTEYLDADSADSQGSSFH